MRVLLLGNNDRSALTCCRALGENGVEVEIAPLGQWGVAHRSRYCLRSHEVGSPLNDARRVERALVQLIANEQYDVVIPLSDGAALLCQEIREEIEAKVALPDKETFSYAHDKRKLLQKCEELGIPVPVAGEVDEPPVYCKPIHSALIHENRLLTFAVKRCLKRREAADFLREHEGVVDVMVQEECPGEGSGVYLLAEKGKILSMVQQNRIHEPPHGGSGSYRVSVPLDPDLKRYTEALIEAIGWTGVAMVEFKGGRGRWRIMELNGRFWGSLSLTLSAGCNYPLWLVQQTLGMTINCTPAHYGVRQRHLGKDLKWAVKNRELLHWSKDLLVHRDPLDVESLDDPMPGLAYWTSITEKFSSWLNGRVELSEYRKLEGTLRTCMLREFNRETHVLFVCRGNICRSSFAEAYCREKLGWKNVRSCGTFEVPNRRVPENAEITAKTEYELDLSGHRSRVLDESLIRWADVIFVMDHRQLVELHPRVKGRMLLLRKGREVHDPYGKGEKAYRHGFREIVRACKEIHSHVKVSLPTG